MEATKLNSHPQSRRILILKFSSIGDIFQALAAADALSAHWSTPEERLTIDWAARGDLASILEPAQSQGILQTVFAHSRHTGLSDLLNLAQHLSQRRYTHVYDAHGSIRSRILCFYLRLASLSRGSTLKILRRPKHRIRRFFALRFGISLPGLGLDYPWNAEKSYVLPLRQWGVPLPSPRRFESSTPSESPHSYGVIVPGSNWEMKNWPADRWQRLLKLLSESSIPLRHWKILGGEKDVVCDQIASTAQTDSVENLRGKLSLGEVMQLVEKSALVVGVDTGWIHWANRLGLPTLALQGPSAFGGIFGAQSRNVTAPTRLSCQPCSKDGSGSCRNSVYQKCLVDISPEQVLAEIQRCLATALT